MSVTDGSGAQPQVPNIAVSKRWFPGTRTVAALMLREMATTYGRSPGGYLWAVLEPVVGILLLTLIFSVAFHTPPLGVNFPIFYATGLVPFTLYVTLSSKTSLALLFSKPLLAYPTITFVDTLVARFLVNMMTQLMVAYLIFTSILMFYDTRTVLDLPKIFEALFMASILAAGVGVVNCYLFSIMPIWQQVWSIINRPMFIISGIFFTFETIPQPYRDYLWYNPLVHVIGMARAGFYPSYDAPYVSRIYVYGLSLGMILIGFLFLNRFYRDLIDR